MAPPFPNNHDPFALMNAAKELGNRLLQEQGFTEYRIADVRDGRLRLDAYHPVIRQWAVFYIGDEAELIEASL